MTAVHQRLALLLLSSLVGAGCGPTLEPLDDETGSTGTVPPDSATASSTAPPPPPPPSTSTTSTTSTSTTGVDGSDESDEVGFIEPLDGGICVVADDGHWHCSQCDLFAQDCPSGEKCTAWANDGGAYPNATRCVPVVEDPVPPGGPCTVEALASGIDDCELGALCWNPDPETLMGTCVSLCTGNADDPQCPASMSCLIEQDGAVLVCLPDCDPLVNDCGTGEACIPAEEGFVCTGAWEAAAGEPCDFFDVCAPGLVCLDVRTVAPSCVPGFAGCCTPWCDLSAPDPSADCFDPAQECVSWWDGPPPAGYETLGACVVPAP